MAHWWRTLADWWLTRAFAPTWASRILALGVPTVIWLCFIYLWAAGQTYYWLWVSVSLLVAYGWFRFLWWTGMQALRRDGFLSRPESLDELDSAP
jgi:hypothetical protein